MGRKGRKAKINPENIKSEKYKKLTHTYTVHYPERNVRTCSSTYIATRKTLCESLDVGCFICGKRKSVDGTTMETHHFFCEYAGLNGIDWAKFGLRAQTLYNPQTGVNIGTSFDWDKVAENPIIFVDSPENMIVLCKAHHRSKNKGIHSIPYPIWLLQLAQKDGYEFLV